MPADLNSGRNARPTTSDASGGSASLRNLLARQNPDGGWPYRSGGSWTEPTAYAVMACLCASEKHAAKRGLTWMARLRQDDGGWPVRPQIPGSGWTTALVALLPEQAVGTAAHKGAIRWLLKTQGEETSFFYRLRLRMLGEAIPPDQQFPGWPWLPGASAWVGPTATAMLALTKEAKLNPAPEIANRLAEGREFLLNRACKEGGWNHGGANALGYPAEPYPETTGMGLMAMRGVGSPKIDQALALAERFLQTVRTGDAQNWLRFGLRAHGRLRRDYEPPPNVVYRTVPELALNLLADADSRERETYLV